MIHVAAHSSYNTLAKMSKRIELFIFHPWFQASSSITSPASLGTTNTSL